MRSIFIFTLIILLTACGPSKKKETELKQPLSHSHGEVLTTFKTITFPSIDKLLVTADLYQIKEPKGVILLCHQAGFSRGEYIEAAKKLNELGYTCIATDQRSGEVSNHVLNETAKRAKEQELATTYLDAKPDIESAINYAYDLNNNKPIILVGSSYSAALSLLLAATNEKIKIVAAFSPGEYLKDINLANSIKNIKKPIFVTSSKKEIKQINDVIKNVNPTLINHFKPEVEGIHGSRALWKSTKGNEAYWKSFINFLTETDK